MKVDLHLHSKHSKRPSQWVLQKLGCPESFSEPTVLRRLAAERGMDAFTLTDHNTIDGCLELGELGGVFISEEVTTYFPEDGCKAHILVWDMDEGVHEEMTRLRENIYDLAAYLNQSGLAHAVAHPLFSINNRLTPDHLEKLLILFRAFELNGARDEDQNRLLELIVGGLDQAALERLMERHGLTPAFAEPWRKVLVGGSDDHSSLNLARRYTEVDGAHDVDGFFAGLAAGRGSAKGEGSSPLTLAHNLYGIAYQFYKSRFSLERYADMDLLLRFMDRTLQPSDRAYALSLLPRLKHLWTSRRARRRPAREKLQDVIRRESESLILGDAELAQALRKGVGEEGAGQEELWLSFVNQVSNRVIAHFGSRLFGHLTGANVFSIFDSLGAGGALFFLLAPYFVSFGLFARERRLARQMRARLAPSGLRQAPPLKVAHFTDTFHEVNGVAKTLREHADLALSTGKDLTILTCAPDQPAVDGRVRNFDPVGVFGLPEYPELNLTLPPLLPLMNHVYQEEYNYLHAATPGPMGLAALKIAQVYELPISGTYHTQLPQYAAYLTGDSNIESLAWRYMVWFYEQMEKVYVPSRQTGQELVERGLSPEKIVLYPRGVDLERFHPRHKNGFFRQRFGVEADHVVLYVGRVSREKDLPHLARAFARLAARRRDCHLAVVGDGPYLEEMRRAARGLPVTFTGYLHGDDLAQAYASAQVFAFPSTTDTFGNVVLEAQASGLPVVVTDQGGPAENCRPGETGLVVPGHDEAALTQALESLCADPARRARMGRAARAYMEERSYEHAFNEHWRLYGRDYEAAA